jgi:4-amino-4-deoxy-L-arabinose transferase-like glycosyltransferase
MLASARVAVVIVAWLATLPYLDKAFHIDDESFLPMARQAAVDPWRPYSFDHNFYDTGAAPAWRIHHPPLLPYFLAAVSRLDGGRQREVPLHLGMSLFTVLTAWAMFSLAERFRAPPVFAGLAVVLSPIVLPGANVMVDLPVLALGVTAVLLHVRGVDQQSSLLLALGGLLAGLAFLTKYNAAVIVPVLGLYSILQRRWRTLFALLVPLAVAALWCLHNLAVSGHLHLLSHVGDPHHEVAGSLFVGLVIIGAAVFWIPLVARRDLFSAVAMGGSVVIALLASRAMTRGPWEAAAFVMNGTFLVAALGRRLVLAWPRNHAGTADRELRDTAFLVAWCMAQLVFTWWFPPFQAVRHYLLALAPLVLLASAGASRWACAVSLVVTAALGLTVAAADMEAANAYRSATVLKSLAKPGQTAWYVGYWGWSVYAERDGMRRLSRRSEDIKAGDVLVVPRGVWHDVISPEVGQRFRPLRAFVIPRRIPVRTFLDQEGFYGQGPTDVPYATTWEPLDIIDIYVAQ